MSAKSCFNENTHTFDEKKRETIIGYFLYINSTHNSSNMLYIKEDDT